METIYKAFDGTEFVDEDDCLEYEFVQSAKKVNVKLYTCTFEEQSISEFIKWGFEGCYAVKYATKEDKERFAELFNGIRGFFGGGNDHFWEDDSDCLYYIYDTATDKWINPEEKYKELLNEAYKFAAKYGLSTEHCDISQSDNS